MTNLSTTLLAKLKDIAAQRDALDARLADPETLADHRLVRDLSIEKAALDPVAAAYDRYLELQNEINDLQSIISGGSGGEDDADLIEMAQAELPDLETKAAQTLDNALRKLVTADDAAIASTMLEIRAGVGGDEAGLWAADLLAMYEKFAKAKQWSFEPISLDTDSGHGGLRAAVVAIRGEAAFATLAHEAGTHCVKRVPATESQGRVHTSTATVAVLPEPRDVDVTINTDDVDEHITTAQGPGGQNVNKVATAVHLIHRPTGVEVRMQETKSQQQNREKAWRLLKARVYEIEREKQRAEEAAARNQQIGSGGRAERIRTYRYKDGIAVDHRLNDSFPLDPTLAGDLDPITTALADAETARRIEAL